MVTPALAALLLLVPFAASARCPARATTDAFLAPGPFGVGERTLILVDTSRPTPPHGSDPGSPQRPLVTEVWYPTAPGGPTPLRDTPVAVVTAFFESTLGRSRAARCFLRRDLATENPDVTKATRCAMRDPQR